MDKGEIYKALDALIEDAYQRGFLDGKKALTQSLMQFAETVTPEAADADLDKIATETPRAAPTDQMEKNTPRAPRGLTEAVMRRVMGFYWMTVEDIQQKAVEADRRISPKTVYNALYRHPELFEKDDSNRWRRRGFKVPEESLTAQQTSMEAVMS